MDGDCGDAREQFGNLRSSGRTDRPPAGLSLFGRAISLLLTKTGLRLRRPSATRKSVRAQRSGSRTKKRCSPSSRNSGRSRGAHRRVLLCARTAPFANRAASCDLWVNELNRRGIRRQTITSTKSSAVESQQSPDLRVNCCNHWRARPTFALRATARSGLGSRARLDSNQRPPA